MGNDQMRCSMQEPPAGASMPEPIIPWIFGKHRRVCEILEEFGRDAICEVRSKALRVPGGALPEGRIPVRSLVRSSIESSREKRQRVNRIFNEEQEFVTRPESA